jgi:hypothetical protein
MALSAVPTVIELPWCPSRETVRAGSGAGAITVGWSTDAQSVTENAGTLDHGRAGAGRGANCRSDRAEIRPASRLWVVSTNLLDGRPSPVVGVMPGPRPG